MKSAILIKAYEIEDDFYGCEGSFGEFDLDKNILYPSSYFGYSYSEV